tara:strand:+ start:12443 stop:13963 length:1521 start_codon:yes stop_codon:yes gene_type:complete
MVSSDLKYFNQAISKGSNYIPIYESWPADLETPLTTWLKIADKHQKGVLLESVEGGENIGRWSIVGFDPKWTAQSKGDSTHRVWRDGKVEEESGNPLILLKGWMSKYKSIELDGLPSVGQLYGMWGYELIQWIEPVVKCNKNQSEDFPDGQWMFFDKLIVFDQLKRVITAIVYADINGIEEKEFPNIFRSSCLSLSEIKMQMSKELPLVKPLAWDMNSNQEITYKSNWIRSDFERAVLDAKEYISKGDVFQLVLSQKFHAKVNNSPFEIYRSLRMVNPSPYMSFFNFGDWYLIGSSPEVMVKAQKMKDNKFIASLKPIAGTRPRGKNNLIDNQLKDELINDPKEVAEHVMLVDLGRNDLGRVCETGSVKVKDLMSIEKYSHVMHIVSEVEGILKPGMDVWDLLKATFPAGTVTGAPKIKAMQLINLLEKDARGPYSGIYGSIDINGSLNTAITIRTMILSPLQGGGYNIYAQAGAGIVADSSPVKEYEETINKARGLFTALSCLKG